MLFGKNKPTADLTLTPDLKEALGTQKIHSKYSTPGVLLGWRYWNLDSDNNLISPYRDHPWNSYLMSNNSLEGESGLYAYASSMSLNPAAPDNLVLGLIAAGGDVRLHETGFRAKNMQILALAPGKCKCVNQSIDGRRSHSSYNYGHSQHLGLDLDYDLSSSLLLEGKESVLFFDDAFSLIDYGFELSKQQGFSFHTQNGNHKDIRPKLIRKEVLGGDTFKSYSYGTMNYSYKNNLLHSTNDEPAMIVRDIKYWYRDGLIHRDEGPAVIGIPAGSKDAQNTHATLGEIWYRDGLIHRDDDLPAVIDSHGRKEWYQEGKLYRENGKHQRELSDGSKVYVSSDSFYGGHENYLRIDPQGVKTWYQNGELIKTQYPGEGVDQEVIESLRDQLVVVSDRVGDLTKQLESLQETNLALVEFIEKNSKST